MKGIVGRKRKSCLELTEIPISTSSFINKTSPTSSLIVTHYWKSNGDRNTRRIKKENKKPKGLTKEKYILSENISATTKLFKNEEGEYVRPLTLVDQGNRKQRRVRLQKGK